MAREINTGDEKYADQESGQWCRHPGEKVLALVGMTGPHKNSTGKSLYRAFFVCVSDRTKNGDEDHDVVDDFYLSDGALFRIAQVVNAANPGSPRKIDVDNRESVAQAIANRPIVARIEIATIGEGAKWPKIEGKYTPWQGEVVDAEGALTEAGKAFMPYLTTAAERFNKWVARQAKKAAGGGYQRRGGAQQQPPGTPAGSTPATDDIPF